jgi:hypothetical protein
MPDVSLDAGDAVEPRRPLTPRSWRQAGPIALSRRETTGPSLDADPAASLSRGGKTAPRGRRLRGLWPPGPCRPGPSRRIRRCGSRPQKWVPTGALPGSPAGLRLPGGGRKPHGPRAGESPARQGREPRMAAAEADRAAGRGEAAAAGDRALAALEGRSRGCLGLASLWRHVGIATLPVFSVLSQVISAPRISLM